MTSVEIFQIYTQHMQDENPAEYVNTSGKRNIWIQSCSIRSFSQCPRKQGNTSSRHPPPCQDSAKNDGVFVSQWKRLCSGYSAKYMFFYLNMHFHIKKRSMWKLVCFILQRNRLLFWLTANLALQITLKANSLSQFGYINIRAPILCCRHFLHLLKQKHGYGCIPSFSTLKFSNCKLFCSFKTKQETSWSSFFDKSQNEQQICLDKALSHS